MGESRCDPCCHMAHKGATGWQKCTWLHTSLLSTDLLLEVGIAQNFNGQERTQQHLFRSPGSHCSFHSDNQELRNFRKKERVVSLCVRSNRNFSWQIFFS